MNIAEGRLKEVLLNHGLSDAQVDSVLADLGLAQSKTNLFIAAYCEAFKERYGTHPVIDGKSLGLARTLIKDLGLTPAISLVKTYLTMNDSFFTLKSHDLGTLKLNLNSVKIKKETGNRINAPQARKLEQEDGNRAVMRRYLEKKQ
jgi:hypothetical protein